jgi:hypothetical protein
MNLNSNPFTPTFGSIPPLIAGRERLIHDIISGLDNKPGDPNRATIFTGARGTGKTVLLATITEEASGHGWIGANVTASEVMLDEIIVQIRRNAAEYLKPTTLNRITGIQIGGFGLTRESEAKDKTTWRAILTSLAEELNDMGIGLLITVDEVNVSYSGMWILVDTFQHMVRERIDVALIMAGLPYQVSLLLRNDRLTYLRRAFQHRLDPIPQNEVKLSMRHTIEDAGRKITKDALTYAAAATDGFAFMIQLVGYHAWRQNPNRKTITLEDAEYAVQFAATDMEQMIFESTIRELSKRDKDFLFAMIEDRDESNMSDIAKRMGVTVKYAGQYRKRLIEQGIIGDRGIGVVGFEIPMLKEYLLSSINRNP